MLFKFLINQYTDVHSCDPKIKVWTALHNEDQYLHNIWQIKHIQPGNLRQQLIFCLQFNAHPQLHQYISFHS